jgi:hypothetical protein
MHFIWRVHLYNWKRDPLRRTIWWNFEYVSTHIHSTIIFVLSLNCQLFLRNCYDV